MNSKEILLRLLYRALIDIRIASRDGREKAGEQLSDLLHNIPLALIKYGDNDEEIDDVLRKLESRAEERKLSKWLKAALSDITANEKLRNMRSSTKGDPPALPGRQ